MQPFGSDRLRERDDGTILLSCRSPKPGWTPRVPKTNVHSEHPGTAVLWGDDYYEVVDAVAMPQGVRYTLVRWRDDMVIRRADRYDAESEADRVAFVKDLTKRDTTRKTATALAFLTGHLPQTVQQHLAHETGLNAPMMTILSWVPEFVFMAVCMMAKAGAKLGGLSFPPWVFILALFLFFEGGFRAGVAFLQSKPLGSMMGWFAYIIFWALHPHRAKLVSPFAAPQGAGVYEKKLTESEEIETAVSTREPLMTLLSEQEQRAVAAKYDYDYRQTASGVATVILVTAIVGGISSFMTLRAHPRLSAVVSLLAAAYLIAEQVYRLGQFEQRPVGSILGFFVKPLTRRFLR